MAENSKRAALDRRGVEDGFQVFAEAHVQHLVGFIQHDAAQFAGLQVAALDMVLQPARRADDDMGAIGQVA